MSWEGEYRQDCLSVKVEGIYLTIVDFDVPVPRFISSGEPEEIKTSAMDKTAVEVSGS